MSACNRNVLILLSDKRSGSTILQDELCNHAQISRVDYSPHTYFETQYWLVAAALLKRPDALYAGGEAYPTYRSAKAARTYLIDAVTGNVPDFEPPQDDRTLVIEGWEALCRKFAKPVFFEKSPQHLANWAALSTMLDWKAQTDITVRFLFLVRNPLAVQHSAAQLFDTPPASRQFGWLDIHRNMLAMRAMLPPEDALTLRYEDMLSDPSGKLAEVCAFAGVEVDPSLGKGIHSNSVEKWREDPQFKLILDPAVRQMALALGYRAEELENSNGVASSDADIAARPSKLRRNLRRFRNGFLKPLKLSSSGGGS